MGLGRWHVTNEQRRFQDWFTSVPELFNVVIETENWGSLLFLLMAAEFCHHNIRMSKTEKEPYDWLINASLPVFIIDLIPKAGSINHRQLHCHSFLLDICGEQCVIGCGGEDTHTRARAGEDGVTEMKATSSS